ncbi:MAG: Transport permease protein [Candidatus Saccharibacteria bacterium]|nr:Transport permease protein [Candidatus Saccharibacteria bacterium]
MYMKISSIFTKKNRVLLRELVSTDFKLRYQGSILGYAWSLLKPLMLFVILYVVFVYFLRIGQDIEHFPVYLLLGIVLWNFFSEMTSQSLGSIVGRGDLIRKIRIPRWIIVFSSSISALINLGLNLLIVVIFMVINGVEPSLSILLLPLNILEIYIFALGVSLFLAAAYVRFRDISYVWEVVLQAGFYATPILYPLSMVTIDIVQKLLLLNPVAQAIQYARYNVVTTETITSSTLFSNPLYILFPMILSIIVLILGVMYFKKHSRYFAENI